MAALGRRNDTTRMTLDRYSRLIIIGSTLSFVVAFAVALIYGEPLLLVGCLAGTVPWLCLSVLRPQLLESQRLDWWPRLGATAASIVGAAGIAYLGVLIVMFAGDDEAVLFALGLIALGLALFAGIASRALTWLAGSDRRSNHRCFGCHPGNCWNMGSRLSRLLPRRLPLLRTAHSRVHLLLVVPQRVSAGCGVPMRAGAVHIRCEVRHSNIRIARRSGDG